MNFLVTFVVLGFLETRIDLSAIEKALAAELEESQTPGAALVVVRGNEVILAKGFGVASVETREPVSPDHLFRLGSTTKLFTAIGLATLAEKGKLDLNRPVGSYLQGLATPFSQVTAHQLLSHTAGIKDQPADYGLHDEAALGEFVRSWGPDYRLAEPGRLFSYSNPGFALAGLLLQEVAGKPYADAMKELVLAPLGMERATFRPTEAMTYPFSQGHEKTPEGKVLVVRPYSDDSRQWPNGFLMASASDMGRFTVAFLNGGLPSQVIAGISTPHSAIPYDLPDMKAPEYGYALFLHAWNGVRIAEHAGTMPGFTSILRMAPEERFAVILLANREGVLFEKTMAAAFSPFQKEPSPDTPAPTAVAMTDSEMESFAGTYRNRWPVSIVHRDGALFLDQGRGSWRVTRHGADRFSAQPPGAPRAIPFRILLGPDGRGELLQMFLWGFKKEEGEKR